MKSKRRSCTGTFRVKVALQATLEVGSFVELSSEYGVYVNRIGTPKRKQLASAVGLFTAASQRNRDCQADAEELAVEICELAMERDCFSNALQR